MATLGDALQLAKKSCKQNESEAIPISDSEAEFLVLSAYEKATGSKLSRLDLYSGGNQLFPDDALKNLIQMLNGRKNGVPLQYLTGNQFFLDHDYRVDSSVLIPRPETEVLVSESMRALSLFLKAPSLGLELGLGSGIISIELLSKYSQLEMIASELSQSATRISLLNAEKILGVEGSKRLKIVVPISPLETLEVFAEALNGRKADFLISNPPYLAAGSGEAVSEVHSYEPHLALYAPSDDPLYFYRQIALQAPNYLEKAGSVFLEVPHERASDILKLFNGSAWSGTMINDLTNRPRVLIAQLQGGIRYTHG